MIWSFALFTCYTGNHFTFYIQEIIALVNKDLKCRVILGHKPSVSLTWCTLILLLVSSVSFI